MARTIIIAGGALKNYGWYKAFLREDDRIICADHGLDHAVKLGVIPDLIVGDFDSAAEENLSCFQAKGVPCRSYKCDKDLTDTQIALDFALQEKPDEIVFLAVLGDRLDHSWSNVLLLTKAAEKKVQARIVTSRSEVFLAVPGKNCISGRKGDLISLLPITPAVKEITTKGLAYALDRQDLVITNPYAVSNVLLAEQAMVSIGEGLLLIIRNYGKGKR